MNLPTEFKNKMQDLLKDEYPLFLAEYNHIPWQALRFNVLKNGLTPKLYKEILNQLGITDACSVPWAKDAFYFTDSSHSKVPVVSPSTYDPAAKTSSALASDTAGSNINCRPGKDPFHEIGLYYIQEPSAMSAAVLLDVHPGERILDLCAAPGGKSTQIAAALNGQGLLISNEINPSRAKILSQNIERMGITNAIVTSEDSARLAERFGSYFHKILVDAPCSGEGMFRKNPEAATEWSPQNVTSCAARQAEILDNAAQMLMPGGTLVYSTCTFSPEENEGTIGAFLECHPEFTISNIPTYKLHENELQSEKNKSGNNYQNFSEKTCPCTNYFSPGHPEWGNGNPTLSLTHRLWPHKLQGEGHYAAVLVKSGKQPQNISAPYQALFAADYNNSDTTSGIMPENKDENNSPEYGRRSKKHEKRNQKYGKRESGPHNIAKNGSHANMDKIQLTLLHEFLTSTLSEHITHRIEDGNLVLFGDQLYLLPEGAPSLDGLRVLRPGLHIGTFRKNRFEPSHALALAIGPEDVRQAVSLPHGETADKYIRGESMPQSDLHPIMCHTAFNVSPDAAHDDRNLDLGILADASSSKSESSCLSGGWTLVCISGFSAGWGKISGGMMKNHYPKGLRKA